MVLSVSHKCRYCGSMVCANFAQFYCSVFFLQITLIGTWILSNTKRHQCHAFLSLSLSLSLSHTYTYVCLWLYSCWLDSETTHGWFSHFDIEGFFCFPKFKVFGGTHSALTYIGLKSPCEKFVSVNSPPQSPMWCLQVSCVVIATVQKSESINSHMRQRKVSHCHG